MVGTTCSVYNHSTLIIFLFIHRCHIDYEGSWAYQAALAFQLILPLLVLIPSIPCYLLTHLIVRRSVSQKKKIQIGSQTIGISTLTKDNTDRPKPKTRFARVAQHIIAQRREPFTQTSAQPSNWQGTKLDVLSHDSIPTTSEEATTDSDENNLHALSQAIIRPSTDDIHQMHSLTHHICTTMSTSVPPVTKNTSDQHDLYNPIQYMLIYVFAFILHWIFVLIHVTYLLLSWLSVDNYPSMHLYPITVLCLSSITHLFIFLWHDRQRFKANSNDCLP
jgi:hypothetical protein